MSASTPTTHAIPESAQRNDELLPESLSSLFNRDELQEFVSDDQEAGRRIGKILSALFIYTLVAMSAAIWWTLRSVGN